MSHYRHSGPGVVIVVTTTFLRAVWWTLRILVVPLARWYWRTLRQAWHQHRHQRDLRQARRSLHLTRRQRRHLRRPAGPDPELLHRAVWWCLWLIANDIPATRVAEQMRGTDDRWADVVGFVAAQAHTLPYRFPQEITAAAWATELRALHGQEPLLPEVNR